MNKSVRVWKSLTYKTEKEKVVKFGDDLLYKMCELEYIFLKHKEKKKTTHLNVKKR